MQENSKSILTNKEKGEHLKEIFESLNKIKKRLERLKSARKLNNTEEAELQEVTIKLKSFYEKCKMFIKFRKNGPGKFMVDEYLKWCNSQKPYPQYGNSQYKSSLECVKSENHMPARPYLSTEPQQINNQYPIANRSMQPAEYAKSEEIYRAKYYRNQPHLPRMGFNQSVPECREHGYLDPRREHELNSVTSYSRYPNGMNSGRIANDSIRRGLGAIEPLQGPLASPRQLPQNAYPGPYFRSPPLNYIPAVAGVGPVPVKTVARRGNYSQSRPGQASNLEPVARPDFQDPRPQQFSSASPERQAFQSKSPQNSESPKTGFFERAPIQNAHEYSNIRPQAYSPFAGNSNPGLSYPPKGPNPFVSSMKFNSSPVISSNPKSDILPDLMAKPYSNKILELDSSVYESLKRENLAINSEAMPKYFSEPQPKNPNYATPDCIQSHFPFEFRFDNKNSQPQNESIQPVMAPKSDPEKLISTDNLPQLFISKDVRDAFFKPSKKQSVELMSTARLDIDGLIKKTDSSISLSEETKDWILIHIDSIMHKIMMFSATLAVDRKNKKFTIDDFKLAFHKIINPSFLDFKTEDHPKNTTKRDYTQHNNTIKLLEDLEWL